MTDLLAERRTAEDRCVPTAWGAPTGSSYAPPAPTGAPPPANTPVPTPAPTVPAPAPRIAVPDHQPRQDLGPRPGTLPVDLDALSAMRTAATKEPLVSWSRVLGTVLKVIVLAALVGAGVMYGPEYYERWFGEEEPAATASVGSIRDEPPAPLAFPGAGAAPVIASATFEIAGTTAEGPILYEITTDFASGVSRTVVTRPDAVSLEVLTVADQALVRRIDDTTWYRTERGGFPFDGQLDRTQWVRLVDELFPAELRSVARITDATESTVAGVPARRLRVTVPAGRLAPPPTIPSLQRPLPVTDGAPAPPPPSPTDVGQANEPGDLVDVSRAPLSGPAEGVDPAAAPAAAPTIVVEVWVDELGIVRQALGPDVFGAERITVTAAAANPWAPAFPTDDRIRPLDADAVVHLGL